MSAPRAGARVGSALYWVVAAALVALGALTVFSVGLPLLVLGLVLAAVAPVRGSAHGFWPPVTAVVALFAAWWLLGPVGCVVERTSACETLSGISYRGGASSIGSVVASVAAAAAFTATRLALPGTKKAP